MTLPILDRHVLRDWQQRIIATANDGHALHHHDGRHAWSASRCNDEPCRSLFDLAHDLAEHMDPLR